MNIDFALSIGLYSILSIGLIILAWFFGRKQKDKDLSLDPKFIWFCSVCTYTYVQTKDVAFSVCPRCGSYNKRPTEGS
ncbi:MAG: hypothetical protein JW788_03225 [Candidatus Omnitrophica bacterium]|nr:hypothetical protein [Candidatus Omnitrophota bacterium]